MFARTLLAIIALSIVVPVGPASSSEATSEALVRFGEFDAGLRKAVANHQRVRIVDVPAANGDRLSLELERFSVTTSTMRVELGYEEVLELPDIVLLRGHVTGEPDSRVLLSLYENRTYGLFDRPGAESQVIVPVPGAGMKSGTYPHEIQALTDVEVLRDMDPLSGEELPFCLVDPEMVTRPNSIEIGEAMKRATPRVCRLALECDYEFWQNFDNLGDALANIYTVMAAISEIYERDIDVKLALTFIRIWNIPGDPYSYVGGASTGLDELRTYWMANHNPGQPGFVERDLAHLRSGRPVGAYAWGGVLCDYNLGYSISGGQGASTAAGLLHDILYAGHELGHNLGGIHTHCFDPPLDQCAVAGGCNQTLDCSTAPGTIMSYCQHCPGGYANWQTFVAPENITLMLAEVASSCIPYGRNPCYVNWSNTGSEDGSSLHPYNTVEEGGFYVQPAGSVFIEAGSYQETIVLWQAMDLQAINGDAIIGQ